MMDDNGGNKSCRADFQYNSCSHSFIWMFLTAIDVVNATYIRATKHSISVNCVTHLYYAMHQEDFVCVLIHLAQFETDFLHS